MKMSDGLSDPCNTRASPAPHPIVYEVLITEYNKSTISTSGNYHLYLLHFLLPLQPYYS